MKSTQKERDTAKRIRKRIRAGRATATDEAWLSNYVAADPNRRRAAMPTPQPQGATLPPAPTPAPPAAPASPASPFRETRQEAAPTAAAPATSSSATTLPEGFWRPPPGPTPAGQQAGTQLAPHGPTCSIVGCPACSKPQGQICELTGERVLPPMSDQAARGAAALVLGVLGVLVMLSMSGTAGTLVPPTPDEQKALAEGLREMAYRRWNASGEWADMLGVGWTLIAYTTRAMRETKKKPKKKEPSP